MEASDLPIHPLRNPVRIEGPVGNGLATRLPLDTVGAATPEVGDPVIHDCGKADNSRVLLPRRDPAGMGIPEVDDCAILVHRDGSRREGAPKSLPAAEVGVE